METQTLLLGRETDAWQAHAASDAHAESQTILEITSPRVDWPGISRLKEWWRVRAESSAALHLGEGEGELETMPSPDLSLPSEDAMEMIISGTFIGRSLFFKSMSRKPSVLPDVRHGGINPLY